MTLTLHGGGGYPTTIVPSPIDRSIERADQSHENHATFIHSLIVLARARASSSKPA